MTLILLLLLFYLDRANSQKNNNNKLPPHVTHLLYDNSVMGEKHPKCLLRLFGRHYETYC